MGGVHYDCLADKTVIVTGGASGIGRALVLAFAAQGARVHFLDIDEDSAKETLAIAPASTFHLCNVVDIDALQCSIQTIAQDEGCHVLINNAADDTRLSFDSLTPDAWRRALDLNVTPHVFAAQSARPFMAAHGGGSIICMGSISWLNKTTGMPGYIASKAAIHGLVRTLARELGSERIRVNALLPGWTMTDRQRAKWIDAEAEATIDREQCLPDRLQPDHIAAAALFLASDQSAMITQQALIIDGGWV